VNQNGNSILKASDNRTFSSAEVEECLVHLIAYQFWRWIGRLIPHERDLTLACLLST
jgi:hypothetical protein